MFYASLIVPVTLFMFFSLGVSAISTFLIVLFSLIYVYLSFDFHKKFDRASALRLMFFSFLYLPIVLISFWLL